VMDTKSKTKLSAAAEKAGAKSAIDFELFEHLHHYREAMRAAVREDKDGTDDVAHNMVRIYDLVLEHGRFFEPSPRPKKYKPGDRHQCFGNSLDLVVAHKELSYCEGYVVVKGISIPMDHVWCMTTDGKAVDVTLRKPLIPLAYFGVVFNSLFAMSHDLPAIESVIIQNTKPTIWRAWT
jgi:hypothetical protein